MFLRINASLGDALIRRKVARLPTIPKPDFAVIDQTFYIIIELLFLCGVLCGFRSPI